MIIAFNSAMGALGFPAKILARARGDGAIMCSKVKIRRMRKRTVIMALIPRLIRKKRMLGISGQLGNPEDRESLQRVIKMKY
jgi:hypothetical protein